MSSSNVSNQNTNDSHLKGSKVLLAEDCPDTQLMISYLLQGQGAEVTVADNGQECFNLASSANRVGEPFDIILMDIQMPVMDGLQATKLLRDSGYKQPILALTARCGILDVERSIESGCDDHISKLVGKDNILSTVERFITDSALDESQDLLPIDGSLPVDEVQEMPMLPIHSPLADREPAYAGLVLKFVDRLPALTAEICESINSENLSELQGVIDLLNNSDLFGYSLLSKVVKDLSEKLQSKDLEGSKALGTELKRVTERVVAGRSHLLYKIKSH